MDSQPSSGLIHTFARRRDCDFTPKLPPIFSVGETLLVSTDRELVISQGVVLEVSERILRVALDRDLRLQQGEERRFHLDRYEYQGSLSGSMVNLIRLMSLTPEAERMRKIVIDR